jgi:hypothetical protein
LADEVIAHDPLLDQEHAALRPWISDPLALREHRD